MDDGRELYPSVSVIIPVYNRANYLRHALASVYAQTYRPIEVIVVDDGSSEDIIGAVKKFQTDSTFQMFYLEQENAGPGAARNNGLMVAQGELIAFLDADDLWYPQMLETLVPFLIEFSDIDLVCGGWDLIDGIGKALTSVFHPSCWQSLADQNFPKFLITHGFPIHSVVTRRRCFERCGVFKSELTAFEDWDLWMRMAAAGCKPAFIDVPAARWRMHTGPRRSPEGAKKRQASAQVLDSLFQDETVARSLPGLHPNIEILDWLREAVKLHREGLYGESDDCLRQAEIRLPTTVFDQDLYWNYEILTLKLPGARRFRKALRTLSPVPLRRAFLLHQVRFHLKGNDYYHAAVSLAGLISAHPGWVFGKAIRHCLFKGS